MRKSPGGGLVSQQTLGKGSFRNALVRELARGDSAKGRTLERIARRLIAMAESGDIVAIKEIMNRVDGAVASGTGDASQTNIGQLVIQWRDPQQVISGDSVIIDQVQTVPVIDDQGTQ